MLTFTINYKTVLGYFLKTVFLLTCLLLNACRSTQSIPATANNLEKISNERQNLSEKSNRHQLKYISETALLLFYQGQYPKAESYFEKAFQVQENSYTRSTTELILSKIINENSKQFRAHYLERWQMRFMAALNFLVQNKSESALVELRRLSRMCRLEKDPFEEKILDQAKHDFLLQTGILMCLLGSREEGMADLRYLEKNNYNFPKEIAEQAWVWNHKTPASKQIGQQLALLPGKEASTLNLKIILEGLGPKKKEQRLSITMLGVLPLIQEYMDGKDGVEVDQVNDIATGVLGKRLIEIAYPVMKSSESYDTKTDTIQLNYGYLYHQSWDAQKNRLIAQSALRVISKVYAAYQVEHAIEKNVEGPWGQLLGNIGRMALWKTEQADLRQIDFMPNIIKLNWDWTKDYPKDLKVTIKRKKLF